MWEESDSEGSEYIGVEWSIIQDSINQETQSLRAVPPAFDGDVTRPRDERNIWRNEDSNRGFFLQVDSSISRDTSGAEPGQPARIFYDIEEFIGKEGEFIALHYWFFYIFNWNVIHTHEGDWEHITLYFDKKAFETKTAPKYIYYAAHNHGHFLSASHPKIEWDEKTHPVVYVSKWGHPSYPAVSTILRHRYTTRWKTWQASIPHIEDQDWCRYDGAWGKVGLSVLTTGPLGPYFKRGREKTRIRRR